MARKRQRRLLLPNHPQLSRTVVEPLLYILALAAFFALVVVLGIALSGGL